MGSREDVAVRIDADTKMKIEEMNVLLNMNKENVSLFRFKYIMKFPSIN
jgi:hypothetical protein